ncbi:MAG: hypothetical protein IJY15_11840, partial [Thermoguttaceae bacterium]|nr:hypothetical protein [Thermoguttaceae bacterium]
MSSQLQDAPQTEPLETTVVTHEQFIALEQARLEKWASSLREREEALDRRSGVLNARVAGLEAAARRCAEEALEVQERERQLNAQTNELTRTACELDGRAAELERLELENAETTRRVAARRAEI